MFKTANYPIVDPAPSIMNGAWFPAAGFRENTPVAVQKPKKKAFSLVKIMSLGSKKGHGQQHQQPQQPQQQQQQRRRHHHNNNNNMPFNIHCHIGKEIKHICSNCSRANDTQDGEWRWSEPAALILITITSVALGSCARNSDSRPPKIAVLPHVFVRMAPVWHYNLPDFALFTFRTYNVRP